MGSEVVWYLVCPNMVVLPTESKLQIEKWKKITINSKYINYKWDYRVNRLKIFLPLLKKLH